MAAPDFIFMLTRGDVTVADARDRLQDALVAGVQHIGFKDIGLPRAEQKALAAEIRAAGAVFYFEMVSLDVTAEAAGARAAVELGADVLMGGVRPAIVEPIIAGAPLRYFPFAGAIDGHPSRLVGDALSIAQSARRLAERDGVHGVDLLAYRGDCDAAELIRAVCAAAAGKPVVVAGSIDSDARILAVAECGAAAFTVGTAALEGVFPAPQALADQLSHITALASAPGARPR